MNEVNKFLKILVFLFLADFANAESKILSIGNQNAKVTSKFFLL